MEDSVKLRNDLHNLRRRGCPPLDLVELMLACTNEIQANLPDAMLLLGITPTVLSKLKNNLVWMAKIIRKLNQPAFSPLDYIKYTFSDSCEQERVRQLTETLHEALRYFSQIIKDYPPEPCPIMAAAQNDLSLLLFYLLLRKYGRGYPTVARLLKAMRTVRESVQPAHRARQRASSTKTREPYTEGAIQQRISRFWKVIGRSLVPEMEIKISIYTSSPKYQDLRNRGGTLLSVYPLLREEVWTDSNPNPPLTRRRLKPSAR